MKPATETRTRGELAALVFERFEQRQSQAEIVIGLRVEPETVRELFDQYCRGLVETQLDKKRPNVQQEGEIEKVQTDELSVNSVRFQTHRRRVSVSVDGVAHVSPATTRPTTYGSSSLAGFWWRVPVLRARSRGATAAAATG